MARVAPAAGLCLLVVVAELAAMCAESAGGAISIEDYGAVAGDDANPIANSDALQHAMAAASAAVGAGRTNESVVLIPGGKEYVLVGTPLNGISNVVLQIDGTLKASQDHNIWPLSSRKADEFEHFLSFYNVSNITITSAGSGLVNGQGYPWWWAAILQTLPADRPKLLNIEHSKQIIVEKVTFKDSPRWTINLDDVVNVIVRFVTVETDVDSQKKIMAYARDRFSERNPSRRPESARSLKMDWMSILENLLVDLKIPTFPLNTDGIDVAGSHVYIHDCKIQNFDDSIAIKPCSSTRCNLSNCTENILIERLQATGVGLSIGSVSPSSGLNCVRDITFRDVVMPDTIKGIYIKTNPGDGGSGIISNVLYENIQIIRPVWWAIWIGPQQQHQPGWDWNEHQECSLDFPLSGTSHCPSQPLVPVESITLRNVGIVDPLLSPGVLLCNETRLHESGQESCSNFRFENVTVQSSSPILFPYGNQYACWNVGNSSASDSSPVPDCFSSAE